MPGLKILVPHSKNFGDKKVWQIKTIGSWAEKALTN